MYEQAFHATQEVLSHDTLSRWRVIHGDAMTVLPWLLDSEADACITGPPACRADEDATAYVGRLIELGRELRRVLRPPQPWWLIQGTRRPAIGKAVQEALRNDGWSIITRLGTEEPRTLAHDFITLFAMDPQYAPPIDRDAPAWRAEPVRIQGFGYHAMPIEMARECIRSVGATAVLDPFCGSGQVGIAALLEGCKFVGIECDADAARLADRRICEVATRAA